MKALEISSIKGSFADAIRNLQSEPVALTDGDTPIAVLLPVENADLETISLSLNPQFLDMIERSRARYYREGGISSEEMRRRLGMEPAAEAKPNAKRKRKAN
jgi:hypothetical protein